MRFQRYHFDFFWHTDFFWRLDVWVSDASGLFLFLFRFWRDDWWGRRIGVTRDRRGPR